MKKLHHQLEVKPYIENLNLPLLQKSCESSTSRNFKVVKQRRSVRRSLFLLAYLLLSSISVVYGICPEGCICNSTYQSVECTGLLRFPNNIPNATRFLFITDGKISKLKRSDFSVLSSLRMLSLKNNSIQTISSHCFNNSRKLLKLNLNQNHLSTFPAESLVGLKRLSELHLQGNAIVSLKRHTHLYLPKLEFMDLESNEISNISKDFFHSMKKLITLKMSLNKIENIDSEWLTPMKNLVDLELENSFLIPPSINDWFSGESMNYLNSINLAFNNIDNLPSTMFPYFPNMTILILNNNRINELPLNISHGRLTNLDLGYNQISRLREGTFESASNLKTLGLEYNKLKSLSSNVFQSTNRLEYLDLSYNLLSSIDRIIFGSRRTTHVQTLLITGNMLQVLHPDFLKPHLNLQKLSLAYNQLTDLHVNFFQGSASLTELHINNNLLVEMPNFRNLENLRYLDVSWNMLTVIPSDPFIGTSLEYINVGHNKIQTIQVDLVDSLKDTIREVILEGNPIRCDCMIYWAFELSQEMYISTFKCSWPIRIENKGLLDLEPYYMRDYLQCSDEIDTNLIKKIIIVWFSILFFIMFFYWIKVYYASLKLWRAWGSSKRRKRCYEMNNRSKTHSYCKIPNDSFWNKNNLFKNRMTSSFRRVRLTESLHSNEYLETIV